jgi:SlyX protein
MEERIAEIEMKISFQDETIAVLNEVIVEQQNKIDKLERMLIQLREKPPSSSSLFDAVEPVEPPPPHY